jgi:hypothetical protein
MKERMLERRRDKADEEGAVLAKIAEMRESDRALAKRLHEIIKASAPSLSPKTWYGMPAYAKDGNVVCFFQSGQKVVLVVDVADQPGWEQLEQSLRSLLHDGLSLEVWDEQRLLSLLADRFGVSIPRITPEDLLEVRQAIDGAKGFHAFGGSSLSEYQHDPLKAELLWHFGFWRLKQLRSTGRSTARDILPPGSYQAVAVLLADLCSFSSYVRDTGDSEIVRESLTSFYSKARYQIINNGGMLYQFAGDEVIGLFGIPDHPAGFTDAVLDTASALCRIGESVTQHWQRRIDRVQNATGLHVGIALGDLQIVSLRPFSRLHVGAIGDLHQRRLTTSGPGRSQRGRRQQCLSPKAGGAQPGTMQRDRPGRGPKRRTHQSVEAGRQSLMTR